MSEGIKIGIGVGVAIGVLTLVAGAFIVSYVRRRRRQQPPESSPGAGLDNNSSLQTWTASSINPAWEIGSQTYTVSSQSPGVAELESKAIYEPCSQEVVELPTKQSKEK
jgi:hypothetical protein